MILCDVNVLVYAHREDAVDHERYAAWLDEALDSKQAYGVSELVLNRFVRVVTNRRMVGAPATIDQALAFVNELREQPNAVQLSPGPRHWGIFERLCRDANATGNLVPDAYLAALAIEHGAELITTDRDFARFDGLRWRAPL
ncbi:MAG: type II toxin-antitoxin system VapC family toxin [Actinobacteria bacterium]|nr:type II toxin-antitoxin system VapC family toxin [Actinomycetota bacterium]